MFTYFEIVCILTVAQLMPKKSPCKYMVNEL